MKLAAVLSALLLLTSTSAFAVSQDDLKLLPKCEEKIRAAVTSELGGDDETFSITGIKLVYGGSKGGLHLSPVVLVRTSDEVEPRDAVVVTSVSGDKDAREQGCKIVSVTTVGDGILPDLEGLER